MSTNNKPTTSYWVIAVIALIWNGLGAIMYLLMRFMTPEMLEALPDENRLLIENTPSWVNSAFAISVWLGVLGALLMLFRKKIAYYLFGISFIAILSQIIYVIFMSDAWNLYGSGDKIRTVMVLFIGGYLVWYTKQSMAKGWLK